MKWQNLYNPIVIRLLRSPLHGAMSKSTMLLTFTGLKSGRTYTTPVNYVRDGDELLAVGAREHSWWKNLSGSAPVTVRVRRRNLRGIGEVVNRGNPSPWHHAQTLGFRKKRQAKATPHCGSAA